eukprot:3726916-Prymnesium_polylepis.1
MRRHIWQRHACSTRLLRARLARGSLVVLRRDDVRGPRVCKARVVRIARKRNAREPRSAKVGNILHAQLACMGRGDI